MRPQFWMFAGPNGAGKSTLVARFRVAGKLPVINPDVIARQINPHHHGEPAIMLQAGRIAHEHRVALMRDMRSFAMETTLSGRGELRVLADAKAAGYKITLVFIGLRSAFHSLARVRERVARGGHDVPVPVILRRHARSLAHLPTAMGLADRCFILDNTGMRPRLLISVDQGRVRHISQPLPAWARSLILDHASPNGVAIP